MEFWRRTDKSIAYFEKFFPVFIQVPEADPAALRRAGTERLVAAFVSRDWFENDSDMQDFRKEIEDLWDERIVPFCRNLRAIGLLANDVSVAAAPLRREVDPVDLTLIELLRRFKPVAYQLVARNSLALTGGESIVRGGPFQTDEDKTKNKAKLLDDLKDALPNEGELEEVKGVLYELFPLLSKADGRLEQRPRRGRKDSAEGSERRISEPGMFPAYFRYELPDAIFSSVELSSLLQRFERASSQDARETVFSDTLHSMEKGSLKRDDFLRKLADSAKAIDVSLAKSLGEAAIRASDKYAYDMMPAFGEAGHVLRMILMIAQRLSPAERVAFLQGCILNASDDTMALRILTILTQQKGDSNIDVALGELYPSFGVRMRKRYGRGVDAAAVDLKTSDPWAFDYWGHDLNASGVATDPEDRKMQHDFWLRYIGNSRARLAQAFRVFFLPVAVYPPNPDLVVENKISMADLRKLYQELPEDPSLTDRDRKSLDTLRRFLDGEFKDGISPMSNLYGDSSAP